MIKKKRLLHYRVASFFMFAYLEYSFNRVDFASSMICFQSLAKFSISGYSKSAPASNKT